MSQPTAEVVICGAGIAGVAAAYHLAVRRGMRGVVLVDERPPLTLTSDKSAECYRNWWPGPGDDMVALMNRSIDLLEELAARERQRLPDEPARLSLRHRRVRARRAVRRGGRGSRRRSARARCACTRRPGERLRPSAADGLEGRPRGTDVITEPALIRRHFPYLAEDTVALLHARRCGWFSGQQLGMYLLERAREHGRAARRRAGGADRRPRAAACTRGARERPGRQSRDRHAALRERGRARSSRRSGACSASSCRSSASATRRSPSTTRRAWCPATRR